MDLSAVSVGAINVVNQNYAALSSAISAAGQNPTASTVMNQGQATTQAQFSMGVLKKTLDIQAQDGSELAQLLSPGSNVDILA